VTLADTLRYSIVGVVRVFQSSNVRVKSHREMYVVFNNPKTGNAGQAKLAVHVRGDPSRFVEPIRRAIEDVAPTLPALVNPVDDLVRGTVSQDVLLVQVTMFFCVVTLVLAALGLYGVTAYSTCQRTIEFGLRAALGAEPGEVTRMVLGEAVRVAIVGIIIGRAGGPGGDAVDSRAALRRRDGRRAVARRSDRRAPVHRLPDSDSRVWSAAARDCTSSQ
jgi:hypothetical protein